MAAWIPVAAWMALDPGGWYPFGPAKWAATTLVALVALAMLLNARQVEVPRVAGGLWLGFGVLLTVSTVRALDPRLAWIGTAERHLGLLAWVVFAACFVIGANAGRSGRNVDVIARGVVVATALAGVCTLVELVASAPVAIQSTTERLGGPFGSAAYLGAAMCLAVPVCAGVAADPSTTRQWRALAVGALALGAMALVGSGTRGAWLGLTAATLVVLPRLGRAWRAGRATGRRTDLRSVLVVAAVALAALALVAPRLGASLVAAGRVAGGGARHRRTPTRIPTPPSPTGGSIMNDHPASRPPGPSPRRGRPLHHPAPGFADRRIDGEFDRW